MSNKWSWKPVLVGAVILGGLAFLYAAISVVVLVAALEPGHPPAIAYVQSLVAFALPSLGIGGLIGAGLGALFAVIRKRAREKGEKASQSE